MGRLIASRKYIKPIRTWLLPILASFAIVVFMHLQFFRTTPPSRKELSDYVRSNQLQVGDEVVQGYQQVYYDYGNVRVYLTNGSANHFGPINKGSKVVWVEQVNGVNQVFLYDLLERTRLQLSFIGVNFDPKIAENGTVTWQRIITTTPQLMQFDGTRVRQL